MKKLLLLIIMATGTSINAQNNIFPQPGPGNVGIGTTSPTEKLQILGTVLSKQSLVNAPLPNGSSFTNYGDRNNKCMVFGGGTKFASGEYTFNVFDFPQSNLNNKAQAWVELEDRNWKSRWTFYADAGGVSQLYYYDKNQVPFFNLNEDGSNNVFLNLPKANSYLSIGTSSHSDNGELYKLTVNGKIRAHAVKVYTDWADFVFEENYNLPSLDEVEQYINKKGHLKNIPSAKDVEENGIELGEMNKLLLQKVEELTLYVIQLNKEIELLKNQN